MLKMSASSKEEEDMDDLAAELDAMDIDKDFALWSSFRSRKSIASSTSGGAALSDRDDVMMDASLASQDTPDDSLVDPNQLEMDDLEYWRTRLLRDEVFSPKYKPSPAEEKEFIELVKFLGMERKKLFEKEDLKWKELSERKNIILKRGPVLCGGQERELVLLSHGFVLAKVEDPSQRTAFARMMISRSYEQCDVYDAIEYIRSVPTTVDVVIEVDEDDDEKEEQGVEVEMSAGELVVLDLDEVEHVTDEADAEEDRRSLENKMGSEDDEEKDEEDQDEEPVASKGVEDIADYKSNVESGEDEPLGEEAANNDDTYDKEDDGNSSGDDNAVGEDVVAKESIDSAKSGDCGHKDGEDVVDDDVDDNAGTKDDPKADDEDSNASNLEETDEDEEIDVFAEEMKDVDDKETPSPPASSPERTTLFGLFGGGKNTPEKPVAKSPTKDSPDSEDTTEEVGDEDESTGEKGKEPQSPTSNPDRRQMFSLFGGGKKSPEKPPNKSPLNSPKSTPEKPVTIEEPPKKKQVTIQEERHTFVIKTETEEFNFECATKLHKEAWLEALERVLVKTRSRARSNKDRVRGWQHALVQTSLHSAAVTGLDELCCDEWLEAKNELDTYNQLAPLHYATMGNMMHIMMYLLEKGADPEVKDEDERTPMYYAQRDELMGAQSLLLDYGAKRSHLCDVEERGVLFQGAAQVAEEKAAKSASSNGNRKKKSGDKVSPTDVESELPAHQHKATKAHGAMNDAMNELRIRGEKINDLADKANALEENVNTYGDLAKQMKAKAKKKKWYNL